MAFKKIFTKLSRIQPMCILCLHCMISVKRLLYIELLLKSLAFNEVVGFVSAR